MSSLPATAIAPAAPVTPPPTSPWLSPQKLFHWLPESLQGPISALHNAAGLDVYSAATTTLFSLVAWAGGNLRIGGLHGSCRQGHGKLILGLPATVSATRVHEIIKSWLAPREEFVVAKLVGDAEYDDMLRPRFGPNKAPKLARYLATILTQLDPPTLEAVVQLRAPDLLVLLPHHLWIEAFARDRSRKIDRHHRRIRQLITDTALLMDDTKPEEPPIFKNTRVSLITTVDTPELINLARNKDILVRNVMHPALKFCAPGRAIDAPLLPQSKASLWKWPPVLETASKIRAGKLYPLELSPETEPYFQKWEEELRAKLHALPREEALCVGSIIDVPYLLYAGLCLARLTTSRADCAEQSVHLAHWVLERTLDLHRRVTTEAEQADLAAHAERLFARIKKGAISHRQLMRAQTCQVTAYHAPALQLLQQAGRIGVDAQQRYYVIPPPTAQVVPFHENT